MTSNRNLQQEYQQAVEARDLAAHALYEAEIAAHDAHQAQADPWIAAAHNRLHAAVVRHSAAEALVAELRPRTTSWTQRRFALSAF
jgi:hypothetical protein